MSYYRGNDYGENDYGDGSYGSKYDSNYFERDRYEGYGEREERDYRGGSRRDFGYDRRDSGYGGRWESDGRRDSGFGGRRDSGRSERDDRRPRGGRGGGGRFDRENGGRGSKRSFGDRDDGGSSKKPKIEDNWERVERHTAMKSHFMETVPDDFEDEWLCIVCPAGKRRIMVAANSATATYNSDKRLDVKFKSCLPSGSPQPNEVMKHNDLTILDTVYDSQKKQFYILDLLHWKHYPYYDTEAEFRAFFLPEKFSHLKTPNELSENNEHPLILLEKFPCTESSIEEALKLADYKVEGLMFLKKSSTYVCSDSPNSLLVRLDQMEKVLGIPLRDGISYTKTTSADAEWMEELKARKKVKADREAAKDKQEIEKKDESDKDISGGTWGTAEVSYSAAYYD